MQVASVVRFSLVKILVVAVLLAGCEKQDETPPNAKIQSPSQGTIYNVFDTVRTTFQFSDETTVVSTTVELINSDLIPVTPKVDVLGRTSAELVIDDKLLATGDYYVRLTVKDEFNTNSEFRRIRIVALPRERVAVYVAVNSSNSLSELWRIDSLFQTAQLWKQPQQDVLELSVNSQYEQVSIAGKMSTWLRTFDANSGTQVWSDQVFAVSQTRRFEDLFVFENSLFVAIYDREIRSYNLSGSLTMNISTQEFRPEHVFVNERFMLVAVELVGDEDNVLNVYNTSTRGFLWQTDFQFEIVSIVPLDEDAVLVFGNEDGQARMVAYNIAENTFWEPRTFPAGQITKVVKTQAGRYAIAHSNGLYAYTYSPNYLNQLTTDSPGDIKYDEDNGTLIVAVENTVKELTLTGFEVGQITLPGTVASFDIYYSR